jgi:hypothetical protein
MCRLAAAAVASVSAAPTESGRLRCVGGDEACACPCPMLDCVSRSPAAASTAGSSSSLLSALHRNSAGSMAQGPRGQGHRTDPSKPSPRHAGCWARSPSGVGAQQGFLTNHRAQESCAAAVEGDLRRNPPVRCECSDVRDRCAHKSCTTAGCRGATTRRWLSQADTRAAADTQTVKIDSQVKSQ